MLRLTLRGKSTLDRLPELAALLREITLSPVFNDKDRFLQLALERKSGLESSQIPAGHMTAMYRAASGLSLSGRCNELLKGTEPAVFHPCTDRPGQKKIGIQSSWPWKHSMP